MRRKIIFFFVVFMNAIFVFSQGAKQWDYPVKPGMEKWREFQSNEEMVAACQIPEAIISSLSTEDLMNLCLRYPLLNDIFAFENSNECLDKLFMDFNGIRELYKRDDVSSNLIKCYSQKMQKFSILNSMSPELEKGCFVISVSALELLLSKIDLQYKDGFKTIMQSLVSGYEMKWEYVDYFRGFGFQTNIYSRSHVLSKIDKLSVKRLYQGGGNPALTSGMADEQSVRLIDELSYQLIK